MSQNCLEDISYESIFNLISSHIKAEHDALWKCFKEERYYKRLIRHGEKQFFEAPNESSYEDESRKAKMNFAEINLLALDLDKEIGRIIQVKLEGEYRNRLKQEVLNTLLKLTSKQKRKGAKDSPNKSEINSKQIEERKILEKIKDLSQYCAENINDIRKQVQAMPDDEYSTADIMDNVIVKTEFEEMETDETQDDLNDSGEFMNENNSQQIQDKAGTSPVAETEAAAPENNMASPHKPQRIRKPNMKYITDNVVYPSKRKSFEIDVESITSASIPVTERETVNTTDRETSIMNNVTPRKRGRPRKHLA